MDVRLVAAALSACVFIMQSRVLAGLSSVYSCVHRLRFAALGIVETSRVCSYRRARRGLTSPAPPTPFGE